MCFTKTFSLVWLGRCYLEGSWAILCDVVVNYTKNQAKFRKSVQY